MQHSKLNLGQTKNNPLATGISIYVAFISQQQLIQKEVGHKLTTVSKFINK